MITIKSPKEIERMRKAGKIAAEARALAGKLIVAGAKTSEVNKEIHKFIVKSGAKPSFLGYGGFPASSCISINEQVIHGIPGKRVILDGDLVSVDIGAEIEGYHGDCAATFIVGNCSDEARKLVEVGKQAFFEGLKFARQGNRITDISNAIQTYVEKHGFSVVRDFVGHGIGAKLHEAPEVPHYGTAGRGPRLAKGMTLAIEPMINMGDYDVNVLGDNWTVVTVDGSLSSHYENTILITDGEPEILTWAEDM